MGCGRARVRVPRAESVYCVQLNDANITDYAQAGPRRNSQFLPRFIPPPPSSSCDSPRFARRRGRLVIYYPHAIGFYAHSRDEILEIVTRGHTRDPHTHPHTAWTQRSPNPRHHLLAPNTPARPRSRRTDTIEGESSNTLCALAPPGLAGLFAMPLGPSMGPSS